MLGAIIGDIAGSRFERRNIKTKEFELLHPGCRFTDDTVMTLAVGSALTYCMQLGTASREKALEYLPGAAIDAMRSLGNRYPNAGYGGSFYRWLQASDPKPYNSYGNGAAMRVSGCGFAAVSVEDAQDLADKVTAVTHNHPEGLRGARATASAVFLARKGYTKEEIRSYVREHFYAIDFTLDEIRPTYSFNVSCQGSVPQALEAFFESTGYEDAIRNAISIGGDSDTIAAIAGGIAEAYYGIPADIAQKGKTYLTPDLMRILEAFREMFQ